MSVGEQIVTLTNGALIPPASELCTVRFMKLLPPGDDKLVPLEVWLVEIELWVEPAPQIPLVLVELPPQAAMNGSRVVTKVMQPIFPLFDIIKAHS